jgi:hypothetical protein
LTSEPTGQLFDGDALGLDLVGRLDGEGHLSLHSAAVRFHDRAHAEGAGLERSLTRTRFGTSTVAITVHFTGAP